MTYFAPTPITVRAASNGNVALGGSAITSLDGVSLGLNEMILLKDQGSQTENGIYFAGVAPPARAANFTTAATLSGLMVTVTQGQKNANTQWTCVADISASKYTFGQLPALAIASSPIGADPSNGGSCTLAIQNLIDALIQYNYKKDYSSVLVQTGLSIFPISYATMDATLVLVYPPTPGSTVTVNLPNTAVGTNATGRLVVALMGDGQISFVPTGGATKNHDQLHVTGTLTKRFQAAQISALTSPPVDYQLIELAPTGGGTIYFPPGNYVIDGVGLKLHPAVNLIGSNLGGTQLSGAAGLLGTQDFNGTTDKALLTICARAPSLGAASKDMFQPIIRDLQITGGNITHADVNGIVIEPGSIDPYFGTSSAAYSGSSATLLNVGVYTFPNTAILVSGDRQRFYCEALRCLNNKSGGLQINGNDAVIGARSGFGSNGSPLPKGGHQVQVTDCSGLVMTGVNVFSGGAANRSAKCLAMDLSNLNGATITGCVINDTINIDGGTGTATNKDVGISIVGCDFNPNDFVFSGGVPVGTFTDDYDTFIRISDMVNVLISGNSFCASGTNGPPSPPPPPPSRFKSLIAAVSSSKVVFVGDATSDPTNGNYRAQPIYTDGTANVSYDLRDLFTGGSASGSIMPATSKRYPDMRGIDPSHFGDTNYAGYAVADTGPILQAYGPEFTADGVKMLTAVVGGNTVVPSSARIAIIDVTSLAAGGTVTVQMPYTVNYKHVKVIFRGFVSRLINIAWLATDAANIAVPFVQANRDVTAPSKTTLRTEVEMVYQPGATGTWWMVTEQPVSFIVQCTPEGQTIGSVAGSNVVYTFAAPASFLITEVRCWLAKPRGAGDPTLAIDVQWTSGASTVSIFTTQPQFALGSVSTADGSSTAGVLISPPSVFSNEDPLQILAIWGGSPGVAKGLKVLFRGFATGGV